MFKKVMNNLRNFLNSVRTFYKRGNKFARIGKYSATVVIVLLLLVAISAEYTSRPSFCPTCHYMETFYQSWKTSAHNKVDCVDCHFEPGISGTVRGKLNGLVQIVNYVSMSYKKRVPWAEIPDNTCAREGCHVTQALQDSTYEFKGINFSHRNHLKDLKRGKTLKCTSCHSQIVQGTHIEVTSSTCFNCHFKTSDDPEHKFEKLSDCVTCHDWSKISKEQMANFRYDHTTVVAKNYSCLSCHTNTLSGNGEVGKERCFQCHFENDRLDKYDDTEFMHKVHITQHSVKCFTCHSPIQHRIQKIDPNAAPDCKSCHTNAHSSQVNLYAGENGFGVDKNPSVMFMNGINCRGCHIFHETDTKDIVTSTAGESSCENCHGKGYNNLIKQWETATINRLGTINTIYKTVSYQVNSAGNNKQEAVDLLNQAYHNLRIVEVGKSVHNITFADQLLVASYNLMKKSMTIIGSKVSLPAFESSAEFIPNECYSCHSGIQEVAVKKFDMDFSHNQHIVKNKISCNKCHSNAKQHGELILSKENCNSCHHTRVNSDADCEKCHEFQVKVYNGNYMGKKQPDIMKEGGVACIDCHSDAIKIIKPDNQICAKCHDQDYKAMGDEWKTELRKQVDEANALLNEVKGLSLDDEQQGVINDTKKLINDINAYKSIYVHNYELLSSLLSEKIKAMKKMK